MRRDQVVRGNTIVVPIGRGLCPALPSDICELVRPASAAYDSYRRAWVAGDYEAAARHLRQFERLLERAGQGAGGG